MAIKVTYRRTSRLSMRIAKNGDVLVSAPFGLPQETVADFIEKNREWIQKARIRTQAQQEKRYSFFSQLPLDTPEQREAVLLRMQAVIPPLVEKYATLMKVKPGGITYQATISRWGCCHPRTHNLAFSVYLLLLPDWCIEHVVVHELAHLLVPNHGERFYAIMDRFFPRWKEARKETKRICSAANK